MEKQTQTPHLPQNAINQDVLAFKHLATYLPYGLKLQYLNKTFESIGFIKEKLWFEELAFPINISECKLILRPFSDYTEISEIIDEMNDYEIRMIEDNPDLIKRLPYDVLEKMFKYQIDISGLINLRLAVSVHDVV